MSLYQIYRTTTISHKIENCLQIQTTQQQQQHTKTSQSLYPLFHCGETSLDSLRGFTAQPFPFAVVYSLLAFAFGFGRKQSIPSKPQALISNLSQYQYKYRHWALAYYNYNKQKCELFFYMTNHVR
jgi:hypothetical protein